MSPMKEAAIRLIQEVPDEKILYILQIIKGIDGLSKSAASSAEKKQDAFRNMQQFRGVIPLDLDYNTELEGYRAQRYADIN